MSRLVLLLLALCLPFVLPGDQSERGRALLALAPSAEPQVLGHLVRDSPEGFRAYCRQIGAPRTLDAMSKLNAAIRTDSRASYEHSLRELYPYVIQMAQVMTREFDRPEYQHLYEFRHALGERGWAHRQCLLALGELQADSRLKPDERLARYDELAARFRGFGDEWALMTIDGIVARDMMSGGRFADHVRLLRSALARARALDEHVMICQLLGQMGEASLVMGRRDSVIACYQEGIAHADRYVIPEQSARLRRFLARFYFDEGRLAAGATLMREAMEASWPHGGSPLDIATVLTVTDWYARLQCWDMVDRNTQRFPALLRALKRADYPVELEQYTYTARRLRAMCLAAQGHAGEAADSLRELFAAARPRARQEVLLAILRQLADVQLQAGRAEEALASAQSAVALADSLHLPNDRRAASLLLARAAILRHRPDLAESALATAQRHEKDQLSVPRLAGYVVDGLAARIALERDDARRAEPLVRRGLASLRDSIRALDREPLSDLTIQSAQDLWLAGHRLFAGSAGRDLAFERHWRSLVSVGAGSGAARPASEAAAITPAARTLQLVYAETPEGLARWTATSAGTRHEVLALDPLECRRLVERMYEEASDDPDDPDAPMPDSLVALARRLGHALLPDEVRSGAFDRVSISAEGPLGRLPFELLDTSAPGGSYAPLLERMEVRYARHVGPRAAASGEGPSVILADAQAAPPRSTSPRQLPAVDAELARARAVLPHARVVRGDETSKQALLDAWTGASIVYVAAHLVRAEDAPLFNYFPIAFGAKSRTLEDDYLDIRDVRDTDLRRCRLVVLSSCASGEPYVAGTRSGPSMADAFVDAGANAVIHTRWRVRDESAAEAAPRLAKAWLASAAASRGDASWRAARLEKLRGPHGIRHPFEWAAWSVTTAVPVPAWDREGASTSSRRTPPAVAQHEKPAPSPARGE